MNRSLILAVVIFLGCASTGTMKQTERLSVVIDNRAYETATVYVLNESGHMARVGRVERYSRSPVTIPRVYLNGAPVRLAVRLNSGIVLVADETLNVNRSVYAISSGNNLLYVVPQED